LLSRAIKSLPAFRFFSSSILCSKGYGAFAEILQGKHATELQIPASAFWEFFKGKELPFKVAQKVL